MADLALALAPAATASEAGSRRRKLWDLPADVHAVLLALAWPGAALRSVLDGLFGGRTRLSDHALHLATARECTTRNKASEHLHRALERRSKAVVGRLAAAKSAAALEALWNDARTGGACAAAAWAALTHPQCDDALRDAVLDAVQASLHGGLAASLESQRALEALHAENAVLARELARAQQRSTQAQQAHAASLQALQTQLVLARASVLERDAVSRRLQDALASRPAAGAEPAVRSSWLERIAQLEAEAQGLRSALAQARAERDGAVAPQRPAGVATTTGHAGRADDDRVCAPASAAAAVDLRARSVLCVGGRHRQVPIYRELVERQGGRFAHHDGGIDHTAQRLDAVLAAADLVICQTGCISHNAYWLVKDHCKRTGKRCVYLDNPSAATFARGLSRLPVLDAGPADGGVALSAAGDGAAAPAIAAAPAAADADRARP